MSGNNSEQSLICVKILDRSYRIKCPPQQTQALQEAAVYVEEEMRKVRQTANINSMERIAVVTALNIFHELMQLRKQKNNYIDVMNQRIQNLQQRIENFLETNTEIEV
ncbi:cell division protein ZapA [Coxiella endosymbiont of Ornithodoros maritimus]|uniref:cell division protein ZapA n=1 Tax=Coxiella endosymbiont of Ornithodoros maritimus TaxID=1656172 RepID=UPI0022653CB9|nr:cell division protein ZapA [Coxiella endosymbiont of Ornithodoros maritimus]